MVTIRDLLKVKGNNVWSVPPGASVLDALKVMADKDVGALLIIDRGKILGILSERDLARSVAKTEKCILDTAVLEYMTRDVITMGPDQTVDDCLRLMTNQHIRHLPIVEGDDLLGLVSIGDLVKESLSSRDSTINHLEDYIEGSGYGH